MPGSDHVVTVGLGSWMYSQIAAAARQSGRSVEDEIVGRLERSFQNRRATDEMEQFLRLAREPGTPGASGLD